jgi:hypothetical protein
VDPEDRMLGWIRKVREKCWVDPEGKSKMLGGSGRQEKNAGWIRKVREKCWVDQKAKRKKCWVDPEGKRKIAGYLYYLSWQFSDPG